MERYVLDFVTKLSFHSFLSVRKFFVIRFDFEFFRSISMSPPRIYSIDETTGQTYANLISQQTNATKALLPPSAVSRRLTSSRLEHEEKTSIF